MHAGLSVPQCVTTVSVNTHLQLQPTCALLQYIRGVVTRLRRPVAEYGVDSMLPVVVSSVRAVPASLPSAPR